MSLTHLTLTVKVDNHAREECDDLISRDKLNGDEFNHVAQKIFQRVKFEFMPRFLLSHQFAALVEAEDKDGNLFSASQRLHVETTKDEAPETLEATLAHPVGWVNFLSFSMYREIDHEVVFCTNVRHFLEEKDDNEKRYLWAGKMVKRFLAENSVAALPPSILHVENLAGVGVQGIRDAWDAVEKEAGNVGKKRVDLTKLVEIFEKLEAYVINIIKEEHYKAYLDSKYHEHTKTIIAGHETEVEINGHTRKSVVKNLESFKANRKLSFTKRKYMLDMGLIESFDHCLTDQTATYFFKKYLMKACADESLLFILEVGLPLLILPYHIVLRLMLIR